MDSKLIKAVVFDVFGTLAFIADKRRPYERMMRLLRTAGRAAEASDAARLMSNNLGLADTLHLFGAQLPAPALAALELDLRAELSSIQLYPDAQGTLSSLRQSGYKIGICSNLAAPYAVPIKRLLLPFDVDATAWSFDVGAVKPDSSIYKKICEELACSPHEILMVGDSLEADYTGPRAFGMHAIQLVRSGMSSEEESVKSIAEIIEILTTER